MFIFVVFDSSWNFYVMIVFEMLKFKISIFEPKNRKMNRTEISVRFRFWQKNQTDLNRTQP